MIAVAETPLVCSACGQPVLDRLGVRLRPAQVTLFDMIEARTGGIELAELARRLYPGVATDLAHGRVKSHVNQINDRLVATDHRIVSRYDIERGRLYFLIAEAAP